MWRGGRHGENECEEKRAKGYSRNGRNRDGKDKDMKKEERQPVARAAEVKELEMSVEASEEEERRDHITFVSALCCPLSESLSHIESRV